MLVLLSLFLVLGIGPLIAGALRFEPTPPHAPWFPPLASVIWCTVAFNLTFFWQELWLVIPKALTPGLSPILYHNDHDWTGSSPLSELLQGTGALATLASGLCALLVLHSSRTLSPGLRLFIFWMAFQGLFQAMSQFAAGASIPGNDVGRALSYLGTGTMAKTCLLAASVAGMYVAGVLLARRMPGPVTGSAMAGTRALSTSLLVTALLCVLLSIAFRVPRNAIEVVAVPLLVNVIGIGWLTLGASLAPSRAHRGEPEKINLLRPIFAFVVLLLVFQIVLRPGIRF